MENIKPILATSQWCGACKTIKEKLSTYDGQFDIIELSNNPSFFKENNIKKLPTLLVGENQINDKQEILNHFKTINE